MTKSPASRRPPSAQDRLLAILPMLERWEQVKRGKKPPTTVRRLVEGIAQQHKVSIGTIWRWYRRFLRYGFAGLAHARLDAGQSRFAKAHPEIVDMIRARLTRGRSAFAIFKSLRMVLGPQAPSYPTVRSLLKQLRAREPLKRVQETA